MDSSCGALQGLSLLHHVALESRRTQLHLRFARAQFDGKSLHPLQLKVPYKKIDVLARVNYILRFTFSLYSNFSGFASDLDLLCEEG